MVVVVVRSGSSLLIDFIMKIDRMKVIPDDEEGDDD